MYYLNWRWQLTIKSFTWTFLQIMALLTRLESKQIIINHSSRSYKNVFFLRFLFFGVKLGHFTINDFLSISNKHTSLPAKKWKNSYRAKKKSFIGSAPGWGSVFTLRLHSQFIVDSWFLFKHEKIFEYQKNTFTCSHISQKIDFFGLKKFLWSSLTVKKRG